MNKINFAEWLWYHISLTVGFVAKGANEAEVLNCVKYNINCSNERPAGGDDSYIKDQSSVSQAVNGNSSNPHITLPPPRTHSTEKRSRHLKQVIYFHSLDEFVVQNVRLNKSIQLITLTPLPSKLRILAKGGLKTPNLISVPIACV